METVGPRWRKSSFSGNGGDCVEVGQLGGVIVVRDSKDRAGTAHRYAPAAWRAFVAAVRSGKPGQGEPGRMR